MKLSFKINRVVRNFILSDMLLFSGWGLITPIFSIFVLEKVVGATLVVIGTSTAIYWLTRSIIQLPLAGFLDRTDGEKDDFYTLVTGLLLISSSAFAFTIVHNVKELFLVQGLYAVGFALYTPAWSAIFSRHMDKNRIALSWSLNSTSLGISAGIAGFLSGIIAEQFGFKTIFIIAGLFSLLAALIIFIVPDIVIPRMTRKRPVREDHTPLTIT
jgi:MFS family permease